MMFKVFLCLLIFVVSNKTLALSNAEILERVWFTGSKRACTQEMRSAFSTEAKNELLSKLASSNDIEELAAVLNPFLFSLGRSHTEFLTPLNETYHFFKGHAAIENPREPLEKEFLSPGVQLGKDASGYFIREVLSGFPADHAGLRRGDRVTAIDGQPFRGSWQVLAKSPRARSEIVATVSFAREGQIFALPLQIQSVNWAESFQQATKNSVRIFEIPGNKKIGYVHLWSGVHPKSASVLKSVVRKLQSQGAQSLILDLRGGYGGAWWEHLDPFYEDTSTYMQMEATDGDGKEETLKSPFKKNKNSFVGPMVVLINEGVRSGKEALAFQFKKTGRATLIGTKTPGYFSAGEYFIAKNPAEYILYLCVFNATLDGQIIEGIGIAPDQHVPFSATGPHGDSQLEAALQHLNRGT